MIHSHPPYKYDTGQKYPYISFMKKTLLDHVCDKVKEHVIYTIPLTNN